MASRSRRYPDPILVFKLRVRGDLLERDKKRKKKVGVGGEVGGGRECVLLYRKQTHIICSWPVALNQNTHVCS